MQVGEIAALGAGTLKSFTEHNQLRTRIISKSHPNYSATNYPSAAPSYKLVLNQVYFEIITNVNDHSAFPQLPHSHILQHMPVCEGHRTEEDDDCLCLFNNLHTALDFLLKLHLMYQTPKYLTKPFKTFCLKQEQYSLLELPTVF